jgi:hypothetical protein
MDPHDLATLGVTAVAGRQDLEAARKEVAAVPVDPRVQAYIVAIARATRESPSLELGVSPRGATMLLHAAKAWAWLAGKQYVTPDEVKAVARPTLRHRIELRADDHRHEDHQDAEEHEAGEDEWFHNYTLMFVIFWIAGLFMLGQGIPADFFPDKDVRKAFGEADILALAEDLELLANSASMVGRMDEYLGLLERAHRVYLDAGDGLRAARCAGVIAQCSTRL